MTSPSSLPPAVNFHMWKPCNLRCRFCFATYDDDPALRGVRGGLPEADACKLIGMLRLAGVEKLNFVGGEPTLCPYLPALLRHSRNLGFVTTLVTNGAKLAQVLEAAPGCLDWVGLSVDSADEAIQAELGRGRGDHVSKSVGLFRLLHERGIRVKLNTVVTSLNWEEDMREFVQQVRPARWKIFQVLPVGGQNDGKVESLLITREQFEAFVARHRDLASDLLTIAAETTEDLTGSYAMIDPLGRFFADRGGRYAYSDPILSVGIEAAFRQIDFSLKKFEDRGGLYEYRPNEVPLTIRGVPSRRASPDSTGA